MGGKSIQRAVFTCRPLQGWRRRSDDEDDTDIFPDEKGPRNTAS